MNDIWFSNIYFSDFDDKESKKMELSHGSSITALIEQEMHGSKSHFAIISYNLRLLFFFSLQDFSRNRVLMTFMLNRTIASFNYKKLNEI